MHKLSYTGGGVRIDRSSYMALPQNYRPVEDGKNILALPGYGILTEPTDFRLVTARGRKVGFCARCGEPSVFFARGLCRNCYNCDRYWTEARKTQAAVRQRAADERRAVRAAEAAVAYLDEWPYNFVNLVLAEDGPIHSLTSDQLSAVDFVLSHMLSEEAAEMVCWYYRERQTLQKISDKKGLTKEGIRLSLLRHLRTVRQAGGCLLLQEGLEAGLAILADMGYPDRENLPLKVCGPESWRRDWYPVNLLREVLPPQSSIVKYGYLTKAQMRGFEYVLSRQTAEVRFFVVTVYGERQATTNTLLRLGSKKEAFQQMRGAVLSILRQPENLRYIEHGLDEREFSELMGPEHQQGRCVCGSTQAINLTSNLSLRAVNVLMRNGLFSRADVIRAIKSGSLRSIKHLGPKTLENIYRSALDWPEFCGGCRGEGPEGA